MLSIPQELLFICNKLFLWRVLFKYFVTVLPFTSGFISSHLFYLELHFIEVSQIFYFVFYLSLSYAFLYYTAIYNYIYIDIIQDLFTISIGISFQFISFHFNSFQFIVGLSISKLEILQFIVSTSNIFQNTPKHSKSIYSSLSFI